MNAPDQIYQFRICLKDITPMILRRILIQSNKTLADLHYVIQIVMGWTDYHLNEFIIHGKRYTIPNWGGMPSANAKKTYPTCISGSGASPEEECGGPHCFNELKSVNFSKSWEITIEFIRALANRPISRG